jgi:SAM-dependent methyltransferase
MNLREGYEKVAHLYDLFDRKENIEFFSQYAADEILDIGAGTGRIAIPLAEKGINVFCVEPSPAMRREFKEKLALHPSLLGKIHLLADDAASFRFDRTFPAAFLSGSFDHFLDDAERISSLKNINTHLNPGGTVVFDVWLGLMKNNPISPAGMVRKGSREYRRFVGGKMRGKKIETILIFETYEAGRLLDRIEEHSMAGITDRKAVRALLKETGFNVKREFSDFHSTAFKEGDSLLIVEAVKVTE